MFAGELSANPFVAGCEGPVDKGRRTLGFNGH